MTLNHGLLLILLFSPGIMLAGGYAYLYYDLKKQSRQERGKGK